MTTIKTILGNRLLIRRVADQHGVCSPSGQERTHFYIPQTVDDREPHFEAEVLAVGSELSEAIKPGDRVICGAHQSQNRVGTRKVFWHGEPCELISTLDVMAIISP